MYTYLLWSDLPPFKGYEWLIGVNTHFIGIVSIIVGRGARPCAPTNHPTTPKKPDFPMR
jgi:hypothetical protein